VRALTVMPGDAQILFAGTGRGVYASEDGAQSWAATNDGWPAARST